VKLAGLILGALALLLAGVALWVRLAPEDAARWHVDPARAPDPGEGGYRTDAVLPGTPAAVLARLDAIAQATPRTIRIAGSPDEGRITWQTRSRLWGFPDYTTAQATRQGDSTRLVILARLRFGKGDLGVNRRRVMLWVEALEHVDE
jgi:Protein of unknown function (DUF1499)